MKEVYEKPVLEILEFDFEDAIANGSAEGADIVDCYSNI